MSNFVSYSQKRGLSDPFRIEEGVPPYLEELMKHWYDSTWEMAERTSLGSQGYYYKLLLDLRLDLTRFRSYSHAGSVYLAMKSHDTIYWDVIDHMCATFAPQAAWLETLLDTAGSAHMVLEGRLVERVDKVASEMYVEASTEMDQAGSELSQSWQAAFGRNADPSDAWDHAIKAIETLLESIAEPNRGKPTLGTMIGALRDKPEKWSFEIHQESTGVSDFITVLEMIWANPDRHGTASRRDPRLEEARAVVMLAVTVVQWLRSGALKRVDG